MKNIEATVFSKPACPFCVKAKELLNNKNIPFRERIVGEDVTKSDIQEMVNRMGVNTTIKTVPQIFFLNTNDGSAQYIGGFTELNDFFNK